jgi:tape measure domain-containing protein
MALNLGNIFATLTLRATPYVQALQQAMTQTQSITGAIRNQFNNAANAIQNMNTQTTRASSGFKDLGRIVSGIVVAQAFYQVVHSIKSATEAVITFSMEMEVADAAFTRMLGSAERSTGFLETMKDFAAVTEYTTTETLDFSRRLQAMGFQATQTKAVMAVLTDEVALLGGGSNKLDRLVYAMGQIKNSAKLVQPEIRQLTEAGVDAVRYLKTGFGITDAQAQNIGKLGIKGSEAVRAIVLGMQVDSKGMAAVIAETTHGMVNTIKDDMLLLSQAIFKGLFASMHGTVKGIRDFMETTRRALREGGIGTVLEKLFPPAILNNIKLIVGGLQYFYKALSMLGQVIKSILKPALGILLQALAIVLPVFGALAYVLSIIIAVIFNTITPIKYLAVALVSLLIVKTVANAFVFLFAVLRLGVIFEYLTGVVKTLGLAFVWLWGIIVQGTLITRVLLGLTIVAVGLLSYFGAVDAMANKLGITLGKFSNIDVSKMFSPEANAELQKWMDEFNKGIDFGKEGFEDTGDAAEDAADKINKTFLASFDEVFNVPEALDKVTAGLKLDPSKFKIPEMPKFPDLFKDPIPIKFDFGDVPWWVLSLLGLISAYKLWRKFKKKGKGPDDQNQGGGGSGELDPVTANRLQDVLDRIGGRVPVPTPVPAPVPVPAPGPVPAPVPVPGRARDPKTGRFTKAAGQIITIAQSVVDSVKRMFANPIPLLITLTKAAVITAGVVAIVAALALIPRLITVIVALVPVPAASVAAALVLVPAIIAMALALNPVEASAVTEALVNVPKQVYTSLVVNWPTLAEIKEGFNTNIGYPVILALDSAIQSMKQGFTDFCTWLTDNWKPLLIGTVIAVLAVLAFVFGGEIVAAFGAIAAAITTGLTAVYTAIVAAFSAGGVLAGAGTAVAAFTAGILTFFTVLWNDIQPSSAAGEKVASGVQTNMLDKIGAKIRTWGESIKGFFSSLWKSIVDSVTSGVSSLSSIQMGVGPMPSVSGGVNPLFDIRGINHGANGAMITRDQIMRVGEGNKKEALIPLENSRAVNTFAKAIASEMQMSNSNGAPPIFLSIGTLIGDERSIVLLERKLNAVRIKENQRTGVA